MWPLDPKQEHKVSFRCSLPSPLQKRSKDYKGLHWSFELQSFLWRSLSCIGLSWSWSRTPQRFTPAQTSTTQTFCQSQRKLRISKLCNSWISSAMAMAMSICRTLCVLVSLALGWRVPSQLILSEFVQISEFFLQIYITDICQTSESFAKVSIWSKKGPKRAVPSVKGWWNEAFH